MMHILLVRHGHVEGISPALSGACRLAVDIRGPTAKLKPLHGISREDDDPRRSTAARCNADEMRAARKRWYATGQPIEGFDDVAARHAQRHGSMAGSALSDPPMTAPATSEVGTMDEIEISRERSPLGAVYGRPGHSSH
jgi:hypothetical protein